MTDQQHEQYEEQHRRWYAEWVRKQYDGPGCRAKIVGRAKYGQIVRAVRGELRRAADNSKFRFWVRAKGFRMGRPSSGTAQADDLDILYVVDTRNGGSVVAGSAQTGGAGSRQQHFSYKKVAVVDEFFDIIYRVHCSGGGVSARHSGQKRTHRMIMETYAFLPREAVTAFLMGCPQCSTNSTTSASAIDASADNLQQLPNAELFYAANVEQWSSSTFACSTPVKWNDENSNAVKTDSAGDTHSTAATEVATGADKENVTDNECQIAVVATTKGGNKRKRTVPLKRDVRQPCQVLEITTAAATTAGNSSSGSSTLKNSSNSSCTLILSSSSSSLSSRASCSGVSKSSGGWWTKWGVCANGSRLSVSVGGGSDSSGVNSNMQPLDLSSSPLSTVSPTQPTIRSSSSPSVVADDFFYKRKRVRRRRVCPKRLNRSTLARRGGHQEDDDTSVTDHDGDYEVVRNSDHDGGNDDADSSVNEEVDGNITAGHRNVVTEKRAGGGEMDEEDDGPKPAKMQRRLGEGVADRKNNNNDDDYYNKATASVMALVVKTTVPNIICCTAESCQNIAKDAVSGHIVMEGPPNAALEIQEEFTEIDTTEVDESDENQEKSAAMHSPINKRINGSGHHPYHMHHTSRSIMNGLATSSSPSSLSKSLDTITTSSNSHHNFHRHWLDMANDSVNNTNMMDVDGSADDNSMAAAAAAAAAALLFSPSSSVGSGISTGGPLSLHPNSHLAHHHALSPLAPLAMPPHSAASIGLTPAHHHHHQHIQQQLQQYAAAAVAAATAAAAAAAAASSAGDSTSPPPNLPLSLPPMAHHYNQNNNVSGSNKRRSTGGTSLTVQQQLYRRSGTPTSSTTSTPSPRLLNSKNDPDTTTSGTGLHENSNFSTSGLPTTTTTVLWPPLGLLTAAHQQHHHSLSSPPKFQHLFGSSVNSLATVTAGSQVLPSLPPPPISSPSSSYRLPSKETNGTVVTTTNGMVTGNDIGIGTGAENVMNADEDDTAIDDDEDEEDEEDEEEEEEDLDDDDIEEGEEDADEEDGERNADGGDRNSVQARRFRRQQVRRLRQLQRAGNTNNNANDGTDSSVSTNYRQQWQQPSTTTNSANSLSQQQHQPIGSSSQHHIDPERLKAFNMFVRLFVDENLDRQVPISRQPKDKVQAIIDSCGRQFPELSDRSRKRIRTYLKSCRRNKRNTPQTGGVVSSSPPPPTNPWPTNGSSSDPTVQPQRPTPAHLTSAQAETILAVACQRESDNARRMRLGLEPVAQPYPYSVASTSASNVFQQSAGTLLLNQNGSGGATLQMSSASSDEDAGVGDSSFEKSTSNAVETETEHRNGNDEADNRDGIGRQDGNESIEGATGGDSANMTNTVNDELNLSIVTCGASVTSSSPNNNETAGPTDLSVNKSFAATHSMGTVTMAAIPPAPTGSGYMSGSGFRGLSTTTSTTTVNHRRISSNNSSSATGMLQLFPTMNTTSSNSSGTMPTLPIQPSMLNQTTPPVAQPSSKLLNKADVVTVRQLIAGYRESAAFLLRSADELEHLLLLRG